MNLHLHYVKNRHECVFERRCQNEKMDHNEDWNRKHVDRIIKEKKIHDQHQKEDNDVDNDNSGQDEHVYHYLYDKYQDSQKNPNRHLDLNRDFLDDLDKKRQRHIL